MNGWLKATLMLLGAGMVLLLAGAFPLASAESVYRGGALLCCGALAGLLCAVGAWRLSTGKRAHFLIGLFFTFLSAAGAAAVWGFGSQAWAHAKLGGAMWFGALAMFCMAVVGLLFTGIFGFFARRLMTRRLWLAAIHAAIVLVLAGAYTDYFCEQRATLRMVAGNDQAVTEVRTESGETIPLGFSFLVEKFDVSHYGADTFTLYTRDPQSRQWVAVGNARQDGDELVLGEKRWPMQDLRRSPQMPGPYLLTGTAAAPELLMQSTGPVRDYCATCRVVSPYRGREESRSVELRVNDPLSFKGIVIHLVSYRPMGGHTLVEFTVRRAPGRLFSLAGMVGLIISTACWCWKRKEDEA